jgi:MFS family permease
MVLLLQPIKVDLHLTDTQLGLLTGIAFGLFYATLGLPIARWSDRGNRAMIASLAIGLWGLTVMSCVLVSNYLQMLIARIAAAVGEAGCKPPTYSLVGDYFPRAAERTRAMAIYTAGNPLAALIAYMIGGYLNERYGWRMTFYIMGVFGLILAAIVKMTVRDPRKELNRTAEPGPSIAVSLKMLWAQSSFRHLTIALVLLYTMAQGLSPWQAAFMVRSHGMGTAELGLWLGLITSGAGVTGILLGGYIASRWLADNERGQMNMSAVAVACSIIPYIAFLILPGEHAALLALIPKILIFNIFTGPTYALMQRLVADDLRATMMALVMLLANVIGMGIGPLTVGLLSDWLAPAVGTDSLRYAMLLMSFVALWAAVHFWKAGQSVGKDLARVQPV